MIRYRREVSTKPNELSSLNALHLPPVFRELGVDGVLAAINVSLTVVKRVESYLLDKAGA